MGRESTWVSTMQMIRRWVGTLQAASVVLVLACPMSLVSCPKAWTEELKIGYVNLARVFDGYEQTKASDTTLEKKGKQKDAELQARMNELKTLREGLELLNDSAREARVRDIEQKEDDLQRFRARTARELRRERDAVAKEILREIQQVIEGYAQANHFSIVLDERSLLYGQSAYDLTDHVLKLLNSRAGAAR